MVTPRFTYRHQYDLESEEAAQEAGATINEEPSLTIQAYKDEVDINVMMARMGVKDGSIPPGAFDPKLFGTVQDFTDAPDLQEIFQRTAAAGELFMQLPADLRRRFGNSPAALMDFVQNPKNAEEAVTLGLLKKVEPVAPTAPSAG